MSSIQIILFVTILFVYADQYSPKSFKEYFKNLMGKCNKNDECNTHGFYDIDLVQISPKMFLTVGVDDTFDGWQVLFIVFKGIFN